MTFDKKNLILVLIFVFIGIFVSGSTIYYLDINKNKFKIEDSSNCTDDWYVTGYFTPTEKEFLGENIMIVINGKENFFKNDFISAIQIEGWGKTLSGNYLGWYNDSFHLNDEELDSFGKKLLKGTIAVDPSIIPRGSKVIIPSLPPPWNEIVLVGDDVGPAIIGKHVDVYTGEGLSAELETKRITGFKNKLCILEN